MNTLKINELKEKYGLSDWWADEVASGNMTIEEAIESQKARDAFAKLQESAESQESANAEEFIKNLEIAASLR